MLNDAAIDVKEEGEVVNGLIRQADKPTIKVTAIDDTGEHDVWIQIGAISSFV